MSSIVKMSIYAKKSINPRMVYGGRMDILGLKNVHFNGKYYYIEDILGVKRTFYET